MTKPRGREHTTLTESAALLVKELQKYAGVKMIAPGIIDAKRSGKRYITAVYTTAGIHFIVSGVGVQKVAVHLKEAKEARELIGKLKTSRALSAFSWNERDKMLET